MLPEKILAIRPAISGLALLAAASCTQPAPLTEGSWTLDNTASSLSFVTVKAGDVGEAHVFKALDGSVAPDGAASLTIDLASVDTEVEIRDQRMRDVLFEVGAYPKAKVSVQLDPTGIAKLNVGESVTQDLSATLDLHGVASEVSAKVRVVRSGADQVLVSTTRPIMLDAGSLGLAGGVEKLRDLAGLPAISNAVPVSFSITFRR